jgi:hypothetical protein
MSMKIRSTFGLAGAAGLAISSAAFGQCGNNCPAGSFQENEAYYNTPTGDVTNGGCNSTPNVFQTIAPNTTVCGTSFTFQAGTDYRDTDWFQFTIAQGGNVSWDVTANFPGLIFILSADCSNLVQYAIDTQPACTPMHASANLPAGTYYAWVGPSVFGTAVPTPQPYVATLSVGATGACCLPGGCCTVTTQTACVAAGGTYNGDGSQCGNCPGGPPYSMVTNIAGTFTDISATGADITNGDDSSVSFTSSVTNALVTSPNLFASTNGDITNVQFTAYSNTALPAAGVNFGLFPFWDDLYVDTSFGGSLKHQNVGGVEIIQWNNVRTYAAGGPPVGIFEVKIFPNGGGPSGALVQYIYQDVNYTGTPSANGASATIGWQNGTGCANTGTFSFNQASVQNGTVISIVPASQPSSCYANCDGSTTVPFLNVLDFNCFLNRFAAGASYANCDNSTIPPVLNVLDFNCFLNRFTQGCSAT